MTEIRPEIPDYYAGKTILITGCTGFIGKVLLWKLLYSCPEVEKIYILLRPKNGKGVAERKETLLQSPVGSFIFSHKVGKNKIDIFFLLIISNY